MKKKKSTKLLVQICNYANTPIHATKKTIMGYLLGYFILSNFWGCSTKKKTEYYWCCLDQVLPKKIYIFAL